MTVCIRCLSGITGWLSTSHQKQILWQFPNPTTSILALEPISCVSDGRVIVRELWSQHSGPSTVQQQRKASQTFHDVENRCCGQNGCMRSHISLSQNLCSVLCASITTIITIVIYSMFCWLPTVTVKTVTNTTANTTHSNTKSAWRNSHSTFLTTVYTHNTTSYNTMCTHIPIHNHYFKTSGYAWNLTISASLQKCGIKSSSGGLEFCILKLNLELLYHRRVNIIQ